MEFIVLSRDNATDFSYRVKKDCVFISITSPELCKNYFAKNPHIKAVLRLAFDDVDCFQEKVFSTDQPMTLAQAKEIVNFVLEWKDKVELIVVHCEAGISRSAGVCAAIMKYLTNDDTPIFNSSYFCPNMFCYRLILNAFMCLIDETEIQYKKSMILFRKFVMRLEIKMKLIDILRLMSFDVDVVIYSKDDDEEPLFKGGAYNVPWTIVNYELDINEEDGTIFTYHETNEHGVIIPYVIIYVIEE